MLSMMKNCRILLSIALLFFFLGSLHSKEGTDHSVVSPDRYPVVYLPHQIDELEKKYKLFYQKSKVFYRKAETTFKSNALLESRDFSKKSKEYAEKALDFFKKWQSARKNRRSYVSLEKARCIYSNMKHQYGETEKKHKEMLSKETPEEELLSLYRFLSNCFQDCTLNIKKSENFFSNREYALSVDYAKEVIAAEEDFSHYYQKYHSFYEKRLSLPDSEPSQPESTDSKAQKDKNASRNWYTVREIPKRRDCLWRIAEYSFIYDDPFKWQEIWKANLKKIEDPDLIFPGQVFYIPRPDSSGNHTNHFETQ